MADDHLRVGHDLHHLRTRGPTASNGVNRGRWDAEDTRGFAHGLFGLEKLWQQKTKTRTRHSLHRSQLMATGCQRKDDGKRQASTRSNKSLSLFRENKVARQMFMYKSRSTFSLFLKSCSVFQSVASRSSVRALTKRDSRIRAAKSLSLSLSLAQRTDDRMARARSF